jgi:uncharacterized protein YjgD (DUF1641 family)
MNMSESRGIAMLQERINEPETAERLSRLLDRLESIENTLNRVEQAVAQGPALVSSIADIADDVADRAHESGINLDERIRVSLALVEKLTEPATVAAITGLLERMDKITEVASLLDDLPGFISMMVDAVDEIYQGAEAVGISIDARVRSTFALGEKLTAPATVDALDQVLDADAVGFVGMLGSTLARCQKECLSRDEPYSATAWELIRASRDPDARRSLGFLVNFGKMFGQGMAERHALIASERRNSGK